MIQKRYRVRLGLWTIGALLMVLAIVWGTALPTQAASPNTIMQLAPSAKISASRSVILAGPGRGFWSVGALRRGEVVPINGVSADRQWWYVNTVFGKGFVPVLDVTASNADGVTVPTLDPIGTVPSGRVTVRTSPGFEAAAVSSLSVGSQFYVIGTRPDGQWIEIRYRFGKGWVRTALTSLAQPGSTAGVTASVTVGDPRVIVNAGALNVRSGPSNLFKSLGTVPGGTVMKIIGRSNDGFWLEVVSPFGDGWVNANHVITRDYFGSPATK
ncbi:MAG: SH3 domain-containing protein [Chloroflexota bacterium]